MRFRFGMGWVLLVLLVVSYSPEARASDEEDIEKVVAGLVEGFRTGNYDEMGRYFAEDCVFVSSGYSPPIVGWEVASRSYKAQHASLTGTEMIREGTLIKRKGRIAWVNYRWQYTAAVGGRFFNLAGHTTLVLEKRGRRWLIVHNHTSALPAPPEEPTS